MEQPAKRPDYGTVEWRFGLGCLATEGVGCFCAFPLLAVLLAILVRDGRRAIVAAFVITLLGYWGYKLLIERHVKVGPEGLAIGGRHYKSFIPWSSIRRADRIADRWGAEHTVLWTDTKRVDLPEEMQHYGRLQMTLWRYLRHYAECPLPRSSKRRGKDAEDQSADE